jgi:Kdo2-lipid IVA lauroyltransferase/acyltransferase
VIALALELLARVVGLLPLGAVHALGRGLGVTAWALGIRRAHVVASMTRAEVAEPSRAARSMYRALGMGVFELLWVRGRRGPLAPLAELDPPSREALARAREGGRGIVLAASHTGNWEIAACRWAEDSELLVVTKRLSVQGFHRFCTRLRAARRVQTAHAGDAAWRARAILRRGGTVAMMLDQVPATKERAITLDFLGALAHVDRAPAIVAAATGAPLVVAASRRNADGTHTLRVLGVHAPPEVPDRAWIERVTRDATRALDAFVRENPSEWLWLHRRWATPAT